MCFFLIFFFLQRKEIPKRKEPQIRPTRQPVGPGSGCGFSEEYQESRKVELRARGKLLRISVTDVNGEPVDLSNSNSSVGN